MFTLNFQYSRYYKNCLLPIAIMLLSLNFPLNVLAVANPPPIVCVTTNDGKCVVQMEGSIGGDGGKGGSSKDSTSGSGGRGGDSYGSSTTSSAQSITTQTGPVNDATHTLYNHMPWYQKGCLIN